MVTTHSSILGLDVGNRRVGVAVASLASRLPRPLATLTRDNDFFTTLEALIKAENAAALVIGLPRSLGGQHTTQTQATETFTNELKHHCKLPIYFQDEAVTSKQAEAELQAHGKAYRREDIDALAATYILEDFLTSERELAA